MTGAHYYSRGLGVDWLFMLNAYVDESGDSTDKVCNFVGLGGIAAHQDCWVQFEIEWKAALDEFIGGKPFHMKDFVCVPGRGVYLGWDEDKRRSFMSKLVSAILSIKPHFVGCVVSVPDFKELPAVLKTSLRDPYYVGFQEVTRGLSIVAEVNGTEPIAMIYAIHEKHGVTEAGMAAQLWTAMQNDPEYGRWMGPYSIGSPSNVYALQAADLFSYELTQEFESLCGRHCRAMRWPMKQFFRDGTDIFVNCFVSPLFEEIATGFTNEKFRKFQQKVMSNLYLRSKGAV